MVCWHTIKKECLIAQTLISRSVSYLQILSILRPEKIPGFLRKRRFGIPVSKPGNEMIKRVPIRASRICLVDSYIVVINIDIGVYLMSSIRISVLVVPGILVWIGIDS